MKAKKGDGEKKTKSLNVLVVDDDEGMRKIFTKWLSGKHRVKTASNGENALKLVHKERFDVVFLDVIMPGLPSLVVLDDIKKISPKTKVVMITGRMLDEEFRKELQQRGASQQLEKPFTVEDTNNCFASLEV